MNDNKPTTEDSTVRIKKVIGKDNTVRLGKVIEKDKTVRLDKVIEKDNKWNKLGKWVGKCSNIYAKKVGNYITTCAKKIGEHTTICAKRVGKYTIIYAKIIYDGITLCAKKITETKFSVIMNVKYSEVYGEVSKALMKISCKLFRKNEIKVVKVEQLKRLDASVNTPKAKTLTIGKISTLFVLIFKKTVALAKCVAVFTLNATIIFVILVARVVYYTAKEIIYASKEVVLALKNDVITWYQSE